MRVVACLAEGLSIRATARVFEVDPNTALSGWSKRPSSYAPLPRISCVLSTWSSHIPPHLAVAQLPSMSRPAHPLISCCYTTFGRRFAADGVSNNLNNINGLEFYY